MSEVMKKDAISAYGRFEEIGFTAGITLKGQAPSGNDPHSLMRSGIIGTSKKIVAPSQVHGTEIHIIDEAAPESGFTADAILSRNPELCLTIRTADCLPLLLADPVTGLFGAVHLGWRGLAGGILENLQVAFKNLDTDLNRLYICLGPAIGECCFMVGAEVAILFDEAYVMIRDDSYFLNIRRFVSDRLIEMGIAADNIIDINECTSCLNKKYYSFRRDGQAREQMISFICRK